MRKLLIALAALSVLASTPLHSAFAQTEPAKDMQELRNYYYKRFPGTPLQEFANGAFALDEARRADWEAQEEFPAYEDAVQIGKRLFEKYRIGACFSDRGVKYIYPYFDAKSGSVRTLEADVMACLKRNRVDVRAEQLDNMYSGNFAAILAYMAHTSRGKMTNVIVPGDPRALGIYEQGRHYFYAKRGQLNLSCADCHVTAAGMNMRGELLSPTLGQTTHWPAWRQHWAEGETRGTRGLGTLHRRYESCNSLARAKPLRMPMPADGYPVQHPTYVALEYFHTFMSNGIRLNGPASRM